VFETYQHPQNRHQLDSYCKTIVILLIILIVLETLGMVLKYKKYI
jgi:hypothetical protein